MTIQDKNIAIAEMLGAIQEEWYPPNKDTKTTGIYLAMQDRKFFPNGEKYCGDSMLKFHSDANWQFEAVLYIKSLGYSYGLAGNQKEASCVFHVIVKDEYSHPIFGKGVNENEAIFEALYQFSQYLKQKK